jgi:TRAP-type uncharacterized transport system fused permease subunit
MKTAINATKLAIAAFIVPYIFALNPSMLFIDTTPIQVVQIVATSLFGLFGVAAALNGYLFRSIPMVLRLAIAAGGLCMMVPGPLTDIIGLVVVVGIILIQRAGAKREAKA